MQLVTATFQGCICPIVSRSGSTCLICLAKRTRAVKSTCNTSSINVFILPPCSLSAANQLSVCNKQYVYIKRQGEGRGAVFKMFIRQSIRLSATNFVTSSRKLTTRTHSRALLEKLNTPPPPTFVEHANRYLESLGPGLQPHTVLPLTFHGWF
jgi:hypothetical protein